MIVENSSGGGSGGGETRGNWKGAERSKGLSGPLNFWPLIWVLVT